MIETNANSPTPSTPPNESTAVMNKIVVNTFSRSAVFSEKNREGKWMFACEFAIIGMYLGNERGVPEWYVIGIRSCYRTNRLSTN